MSIIGGRRSEVPSKTLTRGAAALCVASLFPFAGLAATEPNPSSSLEVTPEQVALFGGQRPFTWSPESGFRDLGELPQGLTNGQASDLFGPNLVIGVLTEGSQSSAFSWDPQNGIVLFDAAPGTVTGVTAVDASGSVFAGWQEDASGRLAGLWRDGSFQDLNTLAQPPQGVTLTEASDISPSGDIVGLARQVVNGEERKIAFVWTPGGELKLLPIIGDASPETAKSASAAGHVIGQASASGALQGYIWRDGQAPRLLTTPDGSETEALGVNASGAVVGTALGEPPRAMIWPGDGSEAIDLNTQLVGPLPGGLTLIRAEAINEAGEIAAYARSPSGAISLVLLTPSRGARAGMYVVRNLGELYVDETLQPLSPLSISDDGSIAGGCAPLARACPAFNSFGAEELAALDGVTNLFTGDGLPAFSGLTGGGLGGFGDIAGTDFGGAAGATGPTTTTGTGGTGGGVSRGTPFFPPVTSAAPTTTAASASPVPLPAAIWALLLSFSLLLRPWRWRPKF